MADVTPEKLAQVKLLIFTSPTCSACVALKRSKTVDKFRAAYPDVLVEEKVEQQGTDGNPIGEVADLADKFNIKSFPCAILTRKGGDSVDGELARIPGGIANAEQLGKLVVKGCAKL